jgi:hypothetical protein
MSKKGTISVFLLRWNTRKGDGLHPEGEAARTPTVSPDDLLMRNSSRRFFNV